MTKTYTLTEEELEQLVNERLKTQRNRLLLNGLFSDIRFENDLIPINKKYPEIVEKLKLSRASKPEKLLYNQIPSKTGIGESYSKISKDDVHNHIRLLVLNVFGKSKNKDLLPEEYEQARKLYVELKEWFVKSYDERLEKLETENEDVKEKTVALQEVKERLDSIKTSLEIKSIDD